MNVRSRRSLQTLLGIYRMLYVYKYNIQYNMLYNINPKFRIDTMFFFYLRVTMSAFI